MDMSIRHLLAAAAGICDRDFSTLKKAYNLIKVATEERSTLSGIDTVSSDLYVLCAELALKFEQQDISQDCLNLYFKRILPYNQFLGRAYLCQAQLYAPKFAENTNDLNKAIQYILKAIESAKADSRYHFLVYNASVLYWRMIRPFLKPGYYIHVTTSLFEVIKALQTTEDLDYEWRAQLMIALVECYLDVGKIKDASSFAKNTAEFIEANVPHMYKKIFSIQVHHSLVDLAKVAKEIKGSIHLKVIYRIQRLKSQLEAKEFPKNLTVQLNQIYQLLTSNEATSSSTSLTSTSSDDQESTGEQLSTSTSQVSEDEKFPLLLELAHLALEIQDPELASFCINDLLTIGLKVSGTISVTHGCDQTLTLQDKGTAMEIECLESELEIQRLGNKLEKCTKSFVERCLTVIRRIDQVLKNAIREGNGNLIQIVCVTQWKLCLPLLQPNLRKNVYKQLINVATILDTIDSLLIQLRCQVHIEVAQIEEDNDRIGVAMEHLNKAYYLGTGGPYQKYIEQVLHRLQLYSALYESPELPEDQAIRIIEQAKRDDNSQCVQHSRSLMVKAGLALAPEAFQMVLDGENEAKVSVGQGNTGLIGLLAAKARNYMNCIQKTNGHLERLENVDDTLRMKLWADLAKVARKQEVWDVCRTACKFCLLYDDGRWKAERPDNGEYLKITENLDEGNNDSKTELLSATQQTHNACHSANDLIRLLADICFINGEAIIQLLKSEGVQFNNHAVFPESKHKHTEGFVAKNPEEDLEWITYRNWIDSLSHYATQNFLRAAELGVELNEALIVCNAAIYIWNHNNHLLVAGRYKELVKPFQTLLDQIKQTGHRGETVLLVMLCNSLCQGLIQPWIPSPINTEKNESRKGSPTSNRKKSPAKKTEKPNISQIVSVEAEGIPHIIEALKVCKYALSITNGSVPSDVVPIAVRHQIIITWVTIKQLLRQQIGPNLGNNNEPNNDSQGSMTQALIALEMYSCNSNNLMKFTVPSLLEVDKIISDCTWSDKLLELEAWTRLMQLAFVNNDDPLVMKCAQKAIELDKIVAKSAGFKKQEKHNYTIKQELLSVVASIQGQSLMKTGVGNSEMHIAAIKAFELSASYGEQAGSMKLVMTSAKHFWNSCLSLIPSPLEREMLEEPIKTFLKAINNTYSRKKKEEEKDESIQQTTVRQKTFHIMSESALTSVRDPEDDLKLRAAIYGLLFHIHVNKGDWKAGLKVLDDAIIDMPRTKQRLLLFKHRIMVNTCLGRSIKMDMQKLKDESEDYVSYMWHRVANVSKEIADQLTYYQNGIDALKKPESNWQKIDQLIEFGEWLYCNGFPINDALCQLDWAADILLSMKLCVKVKEEEVADPKDLAMTKTKQSAEKLLTLEHQTPELVDQKDHLQKEHHSEKEHLIPIKHQLLIGVQSIDTNLCLADLQDVRQLETLVIVETVMATTAGHVSCQQHCLMAYAYVMCIWQVSLASAGILIRELAVPSPSRAVRPDTGIKSNKSNKSKGKKETPSDAREKAKSKVPPETMPANPEEWAIYVCPKEVREVFKQGSSCCFINRKNILKPTYSLFYMDLLIKELEALSYTHLTLPVLQLAELIASEVLDNKSLSDFYHLRIAQMCLELNLRQAAVYHERIPGTVFIYDEERANCRQEIARLKDQRSQASKGKQLVSNRNLTGIQTTSNKEMNIDFSPPVMTRKKLSGVAVLDVWINKAEVLLQLGFYQPARVLLSEAHKAAKELEDKQDLAKVLYLLAVLANHEMNYGQAILLLEEAQSIGGNEYFWYNTISCLVCAILGENIKDPKEQVCNILKWAIAAYQTALKEKTNRFPVLKFMITSMEARLTSIEIESIKALDDSDLKRPENMEMLFSACAKMEQFANIMLQYGHREEAVEMMTEHVGILNTLAKYSEEEEIKHGHLLDAYVLIQKAILIEEEAFSDLMSLLPLKAMTNLSLPLMRKLASLKLIFVQLALDMLDLVTAKDKKKAEAERRTGLLQLIVEEFISFTPDYTSVEKKWVTVARSLGQKALSQLQSVHSLSSGSEEIRAKCLYLTGKCLRLLAVQIDPINPGFTWVQQMLLDLEQNKDGLSKKIKSREENEEVESKHEQADLQLSTQQLVKCAAKAAQLKKERIKAQVYLAHASEVLIQSMNLALNSKLTHILAAASLDMVECFGQFDTVSASQYLALHQSGSASVMMKDVLIKAGFDTSSSQLAALAHLQQKLQEDGTMKNMLRTVNDRLGRHFKAWKNITIQPQHLSFLNEFPSNCNVIVLQHSEDRSMLYGALLEKPKLKPIVERRAKGSQNLGLTQAKIVRTSVNPKLLSSLLTSVSRYKQKLARYLLKLEYQHNYKMQRKNAFQKIQEDIKLDMKKTKTTAENESWLDADFSRIVKSMEDYLNPVLSQFDFTFVPPGAAMDSGKSKSKWKEEKPMGGKSTPGQSQNLGEFVILLADILLLELPLEALKVLHNDVISSVSRDFSLQLLYNRLHRDESETEHKKDAKNAKAKGGQKKNIKMVSVDRVLPSTCLPVDTHNFKYIVDPYDETSDSEAFSPVTVMTTIMEKYSTQFTAHWDGVMGSEYVPSHAEWEEVMQSCSAFIFYGTERFLANLLPSKLVSMNFPECQLMIILDLAQTSQSFRRQSILDRAKSATQLSAEEQMNAALLLSLTGVRSIMINQWYSTLQNNAMKFNKLSKNLLEVGKTTGQTILEIIKSGTKNVSTNAKYSAGNLDASVEERSLGPLSEYPKAQASSDQPEELNTQQAAFNFILYGLPNLIVT
ncbi:cilia- and flagella-associated protein 46 [Heptranchias perlo]|uniref:cilia- and flagella-associated protein 46 n=1 Tax=Heptranchias perlo TaxID=212740 RepID=UPI00355A5FC6